MPIPADTYIHSTAKRPVRIAPRVPIGYYIEDATKLNVLAFHGKPGAKFISDRQIMNGGMQQLQALVDSYNNQPATRSTTN